MDVWKEILGLTFDAAFFALSYSQYSFFTDTISRLNEAEELGLNPEPEKMLESKTKSVVVKGTVVPLTGEYVHSFHSPHVTGVVQKITVTEHDVSNNATGFWSDNKHLIQEVTNTVPFAIKHGAYSVEVTDVRDCYILDLETVAARFEPAKMSTIDNILSFFNGVRQRGIETTEEMLKEGTVISGIGELSIIDGMKTLSPPSDGSAYILTVTPIPTLLKRLRDEQFTMGIFCITFGLLGLALISCVVRRGYSFYLNKLNEKETRRRLEEIRRERRRSSRTSEEEIPEAQRCVVCRNNPREIILLPCGHLCLCEDCSTNISNVCPMCRATISSKYAVFF